MRRVPQAGSDAPCQPGAGRPGGNRGGHSGARGHDRSAAAAWTGRLDFGESTGYYAERMPATWEAWEDVSNTAMGEPKKMTVAWMGNWLTEFRTSRDAVVESFFAANKLGAARARQR